MSQRMKSKGNFWLIFVFKIPSPYDIVSHVTQRHTIQSCDEHWSPTIFSMQPLARDFMFGIFSLTTVSVKSLTLQFNNRSKFTTLRNIFYNNFDLRK